MAKEITVSVSLPGREEIHLILQVEEPTGQIISAHLKAIGNKNFLNLIDQWRNQLSGKLQDIKLPDGDSLEAIMLREAILKAKGQWEYPFKEKELCHCRAVATQKVDLAVLVGAREPEEVSRETSASTGCGTCRPDVQAIIDYRLNKKAA